jgi:hypothetical protein
VQETSTSYLELAFLVYPEPKFGREACRGAETCRHLKHPGGSGTLTPATPGIHFLGPGHPLSASMSGAPLQLAAASRQLALPTLDSEHSERSPPSPLQGADCTPCLHVEGFAERGRPARLVGSSTHSISSPTVPSGGSSFSRDLLHTPTRVSMPSLAGKRIGAAASQFPFPSVCTSWGSYRHGVAGHRVPWTPI